MLFSTDPFEHNGFDHRGSQYVFPIQAKGNTGELRLSRIEQSFAICAEKFSELICRPIAAQFMADNVIAMFEFEKNANGIAVSSEKHYRLVSSEDMTSADLQAYRNRPLE